jgi:putative FmdB family regulatory protein
MPTYEYKCDACGYQFEKFQSITAKPIKKCPNCGKNQVKRLIGTGAGLIFKGGGFYITDYRSDSYKSAAKADNGGGAAKEGSGAKEGTTTTKSSDSSSKAVSTDSKPAAKPTPEAKPAAAKSSKSSK